MLIQEEILQSLLCNKCQQYLNVPPIKVYPNRHLTCGRCSKEGDSGVVSSLYPTIIKNFEFPCVNQYEGCKEILTYKEVKNHELECEKGKHECPFCNLFEGSAYDFSLHLKKYHLNQALPCMEIIFELDDDNRQKTAWICKKNVLIILQYEYDSIVKKLSVNVSVVGNKYRENVTQNVSLYTFKNELIEKRISVPCPVWGFAAGDRLKFDLQPEGIPKNLVVGRFEVKELVINNVPKPTISYKSLITKDCSLSCKPETTDSSIHCNIWNSRPLLMEEDVVNLVQTIRGWIPIIFEKMLLILKILGSIFVLFFLLVITGGVIDYNYRNRQK